MKKSKEKKESKSSLIRHALTGGIFGFLITLVLMPLFALTISRGLVSESLTDSFVVVCVVLGAAGGGVYCAGKQGGGVVTAGAVSAVGYILLVLLITMITAKRGGQEGMLLKVIIASFAGGTFGGVLRLNRKKQKSRLRR